MRCKSLLERLGKGLFWRECVEKRAIQWRKIKGKSFQQQPTASFTIRFEIQSP